MGQQLHSQPLGEGRLAGGRRPRDQDQPHALFVAGGDVRRDAGDVLLVQRLGDQDQLARAAVPDRLVELADVLHAQQFQPVGRLVKMAAILLDLVRAGSPSGFRGAGT